MGKPNIEKIYNKKMDAAVKALQDRLADKLRLVDPAQVRKIVTSRELPPRILMYKDHMTLDIKRMMYLMHDEPFLEYSFFATAKHFGFKMIGAEDEPSWKRSSKTPVLLDSTGKPMPVVGRDSPDESGPDSDKGGGE